MKKLILLSVLAVAVTSLAGCNTCRRLTGGWFNRGDRCDVCPPPGCPPGMPAGAMYGGAPPQVLPGPIEIGPIQ